MPSGSYSRCYTAWLSDTLESGTNTSEFELSQTQANLNWHKHKRIWIDTLESGTNTSEFELTLWKVAQTQASLNWHSGKWHTHTSEFELTLWKVAQTQASLNWIGSFSISLWLFYCCSMIFHGNRCLNVASHLVPDVAKSLLATNFLKCFSFCF